MDVKVTGFEGIYAALRELKLGARKGAARRVLTEALQPVAETARSLAPVDEGDLRDSIVVGTKVTKSARKGAPRLKDGVTVFCGTSNRNAVPREFGSVRTPPHPFLRPAWEREKMGVLASIQDNFGAEIMKTIERAAKRNKGKKK